MIKRTFTLGVLVALSLGMSAQSMLYPKHFDMEQVTLLDGPMKTAMDLNIKVLLQYDVDRLLTPFVRQSGLSATTDATSPYYHWVAKHPIFRNWGDSSFDLSGHVGGHYLSALALAYAACHDTDTRQTLKERLDYMLQVLKDCQDCFDGNTDGLYGFIGGQPINSDWTALYQGNIQPFKQHGGWVPLYVQHKVLAGLRDAYVYGGSELARDLFRKLSDWATNVIDKVNSNDMTTLLDTEHGGMNESLLDAYQLFGDEKYLTAAKKYTHKPMLDGMQSLNTTFLDGKHANTQVPKYIGMERIFEQSPTSTSYKRAADNFWKDVATNRTVCIGGNSVNEHFLSKSSASRYIDQLDGPESCNSNNMLKLTEMLGDRTGDAKYVDFYENTMLNHILTTQDPETGGYVYFTTLRPQGYRIYSQVNQGMWCCVGTGMENHSKYGHFIYTHDGAETLYVNLFTPSKLESDDFVVTQETVFPNIQPEVSAVPTPNTAFTDITVGKAGSYTIAVRHPSWAGQEFGITVNGVNVELDVEKGKASYVPVTRTWEEGDVIRVYLPMELRYEECPGYSDYIAFKFGPVLLGARTTAPSAEAAEATGLVYEKLQNEYAGEGRMDHAPGSMASSKNLTTAPLLIGDRSDVLNRIERQITNDLRFTIDASRPEVTSYQWKTLTLEPFYQIHHSRYMCYWYQQTEENYQQSSMAQTEAVNEALMKRTIDFVAPGEQQSEAGHEYDYSSDSSTGTYNGEAYRDARANGHIQYSLFNLQHVKEGLSIMLRFTVADQGRKGTLTVNGQKIADITVASAVKGSENGFYNVEYPIPAELSTDAEGNAIEKFVVRLTASPSTLIPGLYYMRLMSGYQEPDDSYKFHASDWVTGDPNRVSASNITYDNEANIIHVKASGQNNVALMLDYNKTDYVVSSDQTWLVVRGTNLSMSSGASYLWWLNGVNHGSQVAPNIVKTATVDGMEQQVVAWDMTQSGLYSNFTGSRPNVCQGMTIFGLTSTKGQSDIYDINFLTPDQIGLYPAQPVAVGSINLPVDAARRYTLSGRSATLSAKGITLTKGRKTLCQ